MKCIPKYFELCVGFLLFASLNLQAQLVADGEVFTLTFSTNLGLSSLTVGTNSGNTTLNIVAPGTLTNGAGYIGFDGSSSSNSVTVQNSGAAWINVSNLAVGHSGSGNRLLITNGAYVANDIGDLGFNASSSNNTVLATDPGTIWANSGSLRIGGRSSGNLVTISNAAVVHSPAGFIGSISASANDNTVVVTGSGSLWTNVSTLVIGVVGSRNTLIVSNGATVQNDFGYVAFTPSSTNNRVV